MGRKFTLQRLEWTEENFEWACKAVQDSLHPRHLDRWQKEKFGLDLDDADPYQGHCHTASGALYMLFGPKYLELQKGPGMRIQTRLHFWCMRKDTGEIIDLTGAEYNKINYDYSVVGTKAQMLPYLKYYRAKDVYQNVMSQYASRGN